MSAEKSQIINDQSYKVLDGNEAVAQVAYQCSEVCAIYPITPSSGMGEHCDEWAAQGKLNVLGDIPRVQEMQSEGGAAGAVHGALAAGALTTSFTSSQGLLLMIPDMFKIAGELTPFVLHVAARTVATHALSIFGDHSDVMSVRSTGFAQLFGSSVQEAADMALICHAATLKSRVPFIHAFDGFRTSHELAKIKPISNDIIKAMLDENAIAQHRLRSMSNLRPNLKGTAQNPDVYFQNREACNTYYNQTPQIVKDCMQQFAELSGRSYRLFQYYGAPDADRMIIVMGSAVGAIRETVDYLNQHGEKTGYLEIHLYRPFSIEDFIQEIPVSVKHIAVLDRTKEPGAIGEPLYQDVITALTENANTSNPHFKTLPAVIGGRYGLSSKEFTPAMVKAIFDELLKSNPKNHFTVGIHDDVTFTSLTYDTRFSLESLHKFHGLFYGLGADGTVSANKNSIKIIGESTDYFVQGYFVYDSKKSGSSTTSHLRFGDNEIHSTYLVQSANFVACHQFNFVSKFDMLANISKGGIFLLNAPYPHTEVWSKLPALVQQQIIDKNIRFYTIDASKVAREAGLGTRINTILQTCFFAISGIIPKDEAIDKIKKALAKTYGNKGDAIIKKNFDAVDKALEHLHAIDYPNAADSEIGHGYEIADEASEFVRSVLQKIISGHGDELPVSAFPADGMYPTATTRWEKRNIAASVPVWDENLCTQCNKCVVICPHAAIRAKVYDKGLLENAPEQYKSIRPIGKEFDRENEVYTLQVAVEDCTGCNLCVEYCPAESKTEAGYKAINMHDRLSIVEDEKANWDYFYQIPEIARDRVNAASVKGSQFLQPLFEFSSACAGCGETPYLKILTQLFGDHMMVANATGCSSIYGANLPTTPWSTNRLGEGPSWANSLFEDNAEFGLGIKLASDQRRNRAFKYLNQLKEEIGDELYTQIADNDESSETLIQHKHLAVKDLKNKLVHSNHPDAKRLLVLAENLSKKSVWIIGGDGWAYDIGYGGLDHVLSSGENINIMVLDTEVYSNTGGQTSKSTPIGAIAKFSASGKKTAKKNLGQIAIANGQVYVAQIALGANDTQAIKAIKEAEAYPGVSLIIAYSHCIAHGYDLMHGASQQELAVKSGYWPLYRFNPNQISGKRFSLDSKDPSIPLEEYMYKEGRFTILLRQNAELAAHLLEDAKAQINERWESLKRLTVL